MQIFLTDLGGQNEQTGHAVQYEVTSTGSYLVKGLPLMRTGLKSMWNVLNITIVFAVWDSAACQRKKRMYI